MSVEPIHGPGCTRLDGECVGWHCPKCGYPCSSQGHTLGCPDPAASHVPWLVAPPAPDEPKETTT